MKNYPTFLNCGYTISGQIKTIFIVYCKRQVGLVDRLLSMGL